MMNIKETLIKKRESILAGLASSVDYLTDQNSSVMSDDISNAAKITEQIEVSSGLVNFANEELKNVDEALEKIEKGTYGICSSCDGKISEIRLKHLPYALRCIKCQEEYEGEN